MHTANLVALPVPVDRCDKNVANYENCVCELTCWFKRRSNAFGYGAQRLPGEHARGEHEGGVPVDRCGLRGSSSAPAITLVPCAAVVGSGWLGSGTPHVTLPLTPMRSCTPAGPPPPWPPYSVCELRRPGYKTREPGRRRTPQRRRNVTAPQRRSSDLRCPRRGKRLHSLPGGGCLCDV